jgi:hypothetical protein
MIEFDTEKGVGDTHVEITMGKAFGEEKGFSDGMGKVEEAAAAEEQPERKCHTCANIAMPCRDECDFPDFSDWQPAEPQPETADDPDEEPAPDTSSAVWVCTKAVTVSKPLTEEQTAIYGREIAAARGKWEELDSELAGIKKSYKAKQEAQEDIIASLSEKIRDGEETEVVYCDKLCDMKAEQWVWTRKNPPHDEVMRRKMTPEEIKKNPLPLPLERPGKKEETEDGPAQFVTISGRVGNFDGDFIIIHAKDSSGESDEITEFRLEADKVIPHYFGGMVYTAALYVGWEGIFGIDYAYAVEMGVIEAPAAAPVFVDRSCQTCAHSDADIEDGPCSACAPFVGAPKWEPMPAPDEAEEHHPATALITTCDTCDWAHRNDAPCDDCNATLETPTLWRPRATTEEHAA